MKGLAVLAALLLCAFPASAGLNIAVNPLVIEMQAVPGQIAKTDVNIADDGDQTERIILAPMDWTTRIDGSLAIEKPGTEKRSMTKYLEASTYQFTMRPGEKRTVQLTLSLPPNVSGAAASYWGGFLARAIPISTRANAFGPGATVVVYVDVGTPHRSVSLETLKATANHRAVHILGRVRNTSNAYVRAGGLLLFEQSGRILQRVPISIGAIFPGRFHTINETVRGLSAGKYRVELSIDYGGDEIEAGETTVAIP